MKGVRIARLVCLALALAAASPAVELKPATEKAYQDYIAGFERRLSARKNFLLVDGEPGVRDRVQRGEMYVEEKRVKREPPDGLIHHWEGAIFLPKLKMADVLKFLQDYDSHEKVYAPEVVDSQILSRIGDEFRVRMRLVKKQILTVVLETEHQARYRKVDDSRWESVSRSTKVAEVEDSGKPKEKQIPPGTGNGFVWHMDSFWRLLESDGGVFVECTSVSLSRDVPFGMARLIRPIIEELPAESLRNLLTKTRAALKR